MAGCTAATKVHLFTQGLAADEANRLETSLERHGYHAVLNSLPVPEGIVVPTIVYSPRHKDLERVEALRDLMAGSAIDSISSRYPGGTTFIPASTSGCT